MATTVFVVECRLNDGRAGALVAMETPRRLRDWEWPERVSAVQSGLMVCRLIDGRTAAVDNDDRPP